MNKRIRYIENNNVRIGFGDDMLTKREDSALFENIGDVLQAQFDIEDVQNDPDLIHMQKAVTGMVDDYNKNTSHNRENENFICNNLDNNEDSELTDEIKSIKLEINDNKLSELTAEWVKEWHEKKQKSGASDPKIEEIRNFITEAINSSGNQSNEAVLPVIVNRGRKLFIRYSAIAAAALLAAFLLIKTLSPVSDPEKLFSNYYQPYNAVSSVTRNVINITDTDLSSGIEAYKTGNYAKAASIFAGIAESDPSSSATFFLGLSQIELNNFEQAVNLLDKVSVSGGEYGKEAKWYMGLTYLKMKNTGKAEECFKILSLSDGFYRERSDDILRRLK